MNLIRIIVTLIVTFLAAADSGYCQQAYFADGYHGGVYGHYPLWQTQFIVDKLNENPHWKVNLEIEPESWDVVSEREPDSLANLRELYSSKSNDNIEFANPAYAQPLLL